jgi:hypothetical protein
MVWKLELWYIFSMVQIIPCDKIQNMGSGTRTSETQSGEADTYHFIISHRRLMKGRMKFGLTLAAPPPLLAACGTCVCGAQCIFLAEVLSHDLSAMFRFVFPGGKGRGVAISIWSLRVSFFCNPILFAICTTTFSKLCKTCIQWHVEECSVAFLCN